MTWTIRVVLTSVGVACLAGIHSERCCNATIVYGQTRRTQDPDRVLCPGLGSNIDLAHSAVMKTAVVVRQQHSC